MSGSGVEIVNENQQAAFFVSIKSLHFGKEGSSMKLMENVFPPRGGGELERKVSYGF